VGIFKNPCLHSEATPKERPMFVPFYGVQKRRLEFKKSKTVILGLLTRNSAVQITPPCKR